MFHIFKGMTKKRRQWWPSYATTKWSDASRM